MLPASGMEAKYQSLPTSPDRIWKRDTDGLAAIARHNDGSMGKFSCNG
jgi:hypothetical protein